MSQINGNAEQNLGVQPVQNEVVQPQGPANLGAQPVQPEAAQPPVDVNAQAFERLSDTDRAAAEIFLKGVSTQEALKHTKWSLGVKIVAGLFSFGIAPAIMCHVESKKERQVAADVIRLKDSLNNMANNGQLKNTTVSIAGNNSLARGQ